MTAATEGRSRLARGGRLWVMMLCALSLVACQSAGTLTPTGTGRTPSSGIVPGQTPE